MVSCSMSTLVNPRRAATVYSGSVIESLANVTWRNVYRPLYWPALTQSLHGVYTWRPFYTPFHRLAWYEYYPQATPPDKTWLRTLIQPVRSGSWAVEQMVADPQVVRHLEQLIQNPRDSGKAFDCWL